jgi:hypothetical protein
VPDRLHPHVVVRQNVRCQSTRLGGMRPQLIVVHATQGANLPGVRDLQGVGDWFDRLSTQASSHICVDDEGQSARFVADSRKAWHVSAYNSPALGGEQIGFTDKTHWTDAELHEMARWVARWSILHGIPIQKGQVRQDRVEVVTPGVVRHSELGVLGGNHFDPGVQSYPLHDMLEMARHYRRRLRG